MSELSIDLNRQLLNRYRYVQHEAMRSLAGWLPAAPTFELKCELGRSLWECSLHVNALYLRLREVQSPAFQAPADDALILAIKELRNAPDEAGFAAGYYRVILPSLIAALEQHEKATFPNSDLPSVYALQHILLDLRAQIVRVAPLVRGSTSREWERYIGGLLAAAGGVSGNEARAQPPAPPSGRREFSAPREAQRDSRFTQLGSDLAVMPAEEDYTNHTTEEFERYSTEMLAAETVALVLFSVRGMPWEFEFDTARHLYDEVRHCLMGYEWMRGRGMDPFSSPQYLQIYRWRSQFPPVMQYCMLTMGNEVHAFPYRQRRLAAHRESGDRLSEQFVRYDIADETQHVRFGNRWLPELLKQSGDPRPLDRYTADVLEVWESQYRTRKIIH